VGGGLNGEADRFGRPIAYLYATQGGSKWPESRRQPTLRATGRGLPSHERRDHLAPADQLPWCGPATGTVELLDAVREKELRHNTRSVLMQDPRPDTH
jgi:hypothetical protein